jgi:predicted phage terminase large subunit-like protein
LIFMRPLRVEKKLPDGRILVTIQDPRTEPGELLCPARFPEEEVQKLERDLGAFASAQLQQDPVPAVGGIFQKEWIRYWSYDGLIADTVKLPPCYNQAQSWDLAFKGDASSDPVAGQCWGVAWPNFYLLDQVTGRWDFGRTCEELKAFSVKHPKAIAKYVEEKANGAAVINALQGILPGLEPVDPLGGKEARANAVSGLFRSGNVFLPHPTIAPWVTAFVQELLRFPKAPHDDQVDAMTQALSKLHLSNPLVAAMKVLHGKPG